MFGESFYEAEARSHADIQEEFASTWRFRPMCSRPNYSPEPDPSRSSYELIAIFQWPPRDIMLAMEEAGFSTRDPKITVMRCNLKGTVNQGDLFTYVCGGGSDLSPGDTFEVTDVRADGVSGVEFCLVQSGVQSGGRG